MLVTYHPEYVVDIGAGHRFPMQKYGLVHERLLAEGTVALEQIVAPQPVETDDLLLVHTRDYVTRFLAGDMTAREMRTLGFPWSAALARRAPLPTTARGFRCSTTSPLPSGFCNATTACNVPL